MATGPSPICSNEDLETGTDAGQQLDFLSKAGYIAWRVETYSALPIHQ